MSYVDDSLLLNRSLRLTLYDLDLEVQRKICNEVSERLRLKSKFASHLLHTKIVRNNTNNYINLRIRPEYQNIIYHKEVEGVLFCFMLSEKLECCAVCVAIDSVYGRLLSLTHKQAEDLETTVNEFIAHFNLQNKCRYTYTSLQQRATTAETSSQRTRAHSVHFHIKIFLPINFCLEQMPAMKIFGGTGADFMLFATQYEPLRYQLSRQNLTWDEVYPRILADCSQRSE